MRLRGICLWALALLGARPQQTTTAPEEVIPLQAAAGALHVWRAAADKVEPLEKSGRVSAMDRVGTLNGDAARFTVEGPLTVLLRGIRVGKGAGLALERKAGKLVLKLYKGTVVVESYESEIEVETPFGKVAGKQVYFVATVDEKSAKVVALEGKVTFSNDLGSVTVGEGLSSEADKGKAPSPPRLHGPGEADFAHAHEAEGNLIRNPGFEEKLQDWLIDFLPAQEDAKIVHGGVRSLRVSLKDTAANQPILPAKSVKGKLKPGSSYLFRFYVRTEKFARDGKPADFKLGIDRTGKGVANDSKYHFEFPGSEGSWAARRVTFEATGPDLWFAFYTATAGGPYAGTLWFDDFYLAEIPAGPAKGK
jgi:carbohydrate binding protein with CBM4/9 domain